jgi:hypothetical protein
MFLVNPVTASHDVPMQTVRRAVAELVHGLGAS